MSGEAARLYNVWVREAGRVFCCVAVTGKANWLFLSLGGPLITVLIIRSQLAVSIPWGSFSACPLPARSELHGLTGNCSSAQPDRATLLTRRPQQGASCSHGGHRVWKARKVASNI